MAFGLTVLAVGAMLLYIGVKGISFAEFWQRILGGSLA